MFIGLRKIKSNRIVAIINHIFLLAIYIYKNVIAQQSQYIFKTRDMLLNKHLPSSQVDIMDCFADPRPTGNNGPSQWQGLCTKQWTTRSRERCFHPEHPIDSIRHAIRLQEASISNKSLLCDVHKEGTGINESRWS